MQSPRTPSNAERAVRRKLEKRFTTLYAFTHNCTTPSTEQLNNHINYEMHLAKVFTLSSEFEQDVWDMVYDEGVETGSDERLEALCDEWKVPEASLACRNKVKVLSACAQSNSDRSNADGYYSRRSSTMQGERFESTANSSITRIGAKLSGVSAPT
jgi:hypothetical protein